MKHTRKIVVGAGLGLVAFGLSSQDASACYEGNMPDWCYETPQTTEPEETTPTTEAPPETTEPAPTTSEIIITDTVPVTTIVEVVPTTLSVPVTTVVEAVSTTVVTPEVPTTTQAIVTPAPAPQSPQGELPRTGSDENVMIALAIAGIASGATLVAVTRQRKSV